MNLTLKLHSQSLLSSPSFRNSPKQHKYLGFVLSQKFSTSSSPSLSSSSFPHSVSPIRRCVPEKILGSLEPDRVLENVSIFTQEVIKNENGVLKILKRANSISAHVVLASTLLALIYPSSFTWFTSRYYAPCLGFFMFSVGMNSSEKDFIQAFKRPGAICAGYIGQFVVKPLFGYLFGILAVKIFNLPTSIGAGIMLTSCVSGAQLSNYTTFLTDPSMAPLSIVMTSLSTATAVFVTPALSFLLIGKSLPVDVKGIMSSIIQIVIAPIVAGLLLNRFFPSICAGVKQWLPPFSLALMALCNGSPIAMNRAAIISPFGLILLLLIVGFHFSSFVAGYYLPGIFFRKAPDVKALQRTISYETGMQSSLLALALANKFFEDPLMGVPPAISVAAMSLMGFYLVMLWSKKIQSTR